MTGGEIRGSGGGGKIICWWGVPVELLSLREGLVPTPVVACLGPPTPVVACLGPPTPVVACLGPPTPVVACLGKSISLQVNQNTLHSFFFIGIISFSLSGCKSWSCRLDMCIGTAEGCTPLQQIQHSNRPQLMKTGIYCRSTSRMQTTAVPTTEQAQGDGQQWFCRSSVMWKWL